MNDIDARHEVPGLTAEEAYGAVAGEMYLPGEVDYRSAEDVLAELEPAIVKAAHDYAELMHFAWPPIASGYIAMVQVASEQGVTVPDLGAEWFGKEVATDR